MKKGILVVGVLVVALGALLVAALVDVAPEPEPLGPKGQAPSTTPSPSIAQPTVSPSAEQPSPSRSVSGEPTGIELANLTDGYVMKAGYFQTASTDPVFLDDEKVTIVHLFSCCDHASAPTVTAGATTFDLLVTHETGEKRHWVYRAVGEDVEVPIEFTFDVPQNIAQWIVDEASGVPTTANGADAIGATAWQDSQENDSRGNIDLAATSGATVGFGMIGSGRARAIVPEAGFEPTAEVGAGSYQIVTFWSPTPDTNLAATFVDENGTPQVMSWLFLAVELLPSNG